MSMREGMALENIRVLKDAGIVNATISLRQIVGAAAKIPGINDGNPVAWELVTRDYCYKGKDVAAASGRLTDAVVSALQESAILNFDITLGQIIDASSRLPGMSDGNPVAWELISRDFVLRGKFGLDSTSALGSAARSRTVLSAP